MFVTGSFFFLFKTRKLANKHEAQADEITTKSQQAATESKEVVKVVDEAVGIQNQTSVDIEDLYRRLEETEQLQVNGDDVFRFSQLTQS